jgi:D-tagatose-1,6-bisphosphate aldolase subunit GatZ/KbaZ
VVTPPEDVRETIEVTREAFRQRGVESAWERVIAVVVQPGVEFGDDSLHVYDRERARPLIQFIEQQSGLVYEAHSTDYQRASVLRQLVEDHFAILKVGPALTHALREGIFALAHIETELLGGQPGITLSQLPAALEAAMMADPRYWQRHYRGSQPQQRLARTYSYSDRIRYYWAVPTVQAALQRLWANLEATSIPLTLLSQYLPVQYGRVRDGRLTSTPQRLAQDKVGQVLSDYADACGYRSDVP